MPIYEYRCNACGHKLESLQRRLDAPLVACPACGKDALTKLVSAAGFQLKGSGWYATDFKNSGSKPPAGDLAKADGRTDAAATASAGSKSDAAASSGARSDTAAASSSPKSGDPGKAESRAAQDKAAATGTTTTGS